MSRIPFSEVHLALAGVLTRLGFSTERAGLCAQLFAETTRDGVYTHGVNRFPRFITSIRNGTVDPSAQPELTSRSGPMERWDGCSGPGNLNAWAAMQRAMSLSLVHGLGCVAMRNTNHWMRGGTYGWQAVEAGLISICWTNTLANLPPWGAAEPAIGNNPLVIAAPRVGGHLVLDMAMSQFSYGAMERYRKQGELLPVEGGFDAEGKLTRDPAAIEQSQRPLPVGFWKGSGLSILLDVLAATLSLGNATNEINRDPEREKGVSQVFLAFDPGPNSQAARIADKIVASLHGAKPVANGHRVRYPGEQTLRIRNENMRLGLPIEPAVWDQIRSV
jgi:3-dehydro-L-gulonate 2-dehydrogenase